MGGRRSTHRVLVGRLKRRWDDNIKMDLREVVLGLDGYSLGKGQVVGCFECGMNLRFP